MKMRNTDRLLGRSSPIQDALRAGGLKKVDTLGTKDSKTRTAGLADRFHEPPTAQHDATKCPRCGHALVRAALGKESNQHPIMYCDHGCRMALPCAE